MSPSPLSIGIAGFGTVGKEVCRILSESQTTLPGKCGHSIVVRRIAVRNPLRHRPAVAEFLATAADLLTSRWQDLVADDQIQIIVELIGGCDEAFALVKAALERGKHVVTANKALLAEHGDELFRLAESRHCHLLFEASVAGGIPILGTLRDGLGGDRITAIRGILNGTTNLILSSMQNDGLSFEIALREAKRLGFAEADPTFDVSGADAAQKLAILTHMGLERKIHWRSIPRVGITEISPNDITMSLARGFTIRLVAMVDLPQAGQGSVSVCPTLVPLRSIWGQCSGASNVIEVHAKNLGPLILQGAGAGGAPTASAVVADLVTLARNWGRGTGQRYGWDPDLIVFPGSQVADQAYFLRWLVSQESQIGPLSQAVTKLLCIQKVHGSVFTQAASDDAVPCVSAWTSTRIERTTLAVIEDGIRRDGFDRGVSFAAYPILH